MVLVAQQSIDREREAGLRGDALTWGIVGLCAVFVVGIGVVVAVVVRRRR